MRVHQIQHRAHMDKIFNCIKKDDDTQLTSWFILFLEHTNSHSEGLLCGVESKHMREVMVYCKYKK